MALFLMPQGSARGPDPPSALKSGLGLSWGLTRPISSARLQAECASLTKLLHSLGLPDFYPFLPRMLQALILQCLK
jgi:hypothetical protein